MTPERVIVESAYALACSLPSSTVEAVAAAILTSPTGSLRAEITRRVAHHQHRDLALAFVDRWRSEVCEIDARIVAVALQSVAMSEQAHRDSQSVELVWTGPDTEQTPFRRTEQAILQVLDGGEDPDHPRQFCSLSNTKRGQRSCSGCKTGSADYRDCGNARQARWLGGENEYSTIRALGEEVAACSSVYFWPKENRPVAENNKTGILHVKCAVADGERLFLSSANLTQQAFTINMEFGGKERWASALGMVVSFRIRRGSV